MICGHRSIRCISISTFDAPLSVVAFDIVGDLTDHLVLLLDHQNANVIQQGITRTSPEAELPMVSAAEDGVEVTNDCDTELQFAGQAVAKTIPPIRSPHTLPMFAQTPQVRGATTTSHHAQMHTCMDRVAQSGQMHKCTSTSTRHKIKRLQYSTAGFLQDKVKAGRTLLKNAQTHTEKISTHGMHSRIALAGNTAV